jgi:RNA polymerase sigma-70 factor (ECF subfamily)
MVLEAGGSSTEGKSALEHLCRTYWYPLYLYVRRQGHPVEDAQDLTQQFFARLLEREYLRLADKTRGRFRTFLLSSLKRFLINEWKQANRQKRGGGFEFVSRDADTVEGRFLAEPADHRTPDKAYERQWALVVLGRVLEQLRAEFASVGRALVFDALKPQLIGDGCDDSYAEIGRRLGMTEANLKVTMHRLRHRFRDLLKQEIRQTVANQTEVEEEIQHLIVALTD